MKQHNQSGFSLIELLIVVAIVSILAAIAIPTYDNYVTNTRRAEAKVSLMSANNLMEQFFANNNTYATATIAAGVPTTDILGAALTTEGWYSISITAQSATGFTLTATPQGAQAAGDAACANFTISNLGVRGISGTGTVTDCW